MKNVERYIYWVIILILVVVIICGVVYIVNKNNNEEINNSNNNNSEEEVEQHEEEETLTDTELRGYLRYVPRDIMNEEQNVYVTPTNLDNMNISYVLGGVLDYARNYTNLQIGADSQDELYFSATDINRLMLRLYNMEINDLIESDRIAVAEFSGKVYYYYNNLFRLTGESTYEGRHLSVVDDYEITDEELVIYEYAAEALILEEEIVISDYYKDSEVTISDIKTDLDSYMEEHKEEYTRYKHTYKVNRYGYYWYSTEAI